jgi:zinc protease
MTTLLNTLPRALVTRVPQVSLVLATMCSAIFTQAQAQAQTAVDPMPALGPAPKISIAVPSEQSLPNGLRVVTAPRTGLPIVSALLVVRTGAEADPKGKAGVADMAASLMTKGTRTRSATQIAQIAEGLGSGISSGAGWHNASVSMTVSTPKLPQALGLMSDVARNPMFAQAELDRQRRQSLDALKVSLADPGRVANLAVVRAHYGASVYGNTAGGLPASLNRITRADLQRFHAQAFQPANAVLVLAGDLTPEQALRLAQSAFGNWRGTGKTLAAEVIAPAQSQAAAVTLIDIPAAGQAGVSVAVPAVPVAAPDFDAGMVANAVLGNGYSSRLNQEIRIKRGLSYGAGSRLDARRAGGMLRASVQTKNESAVQVAELVRAQIDSLSAAPVPVDELTVRKATVMGEYARSLETVDGLAGQVSALLVNDLPLTRLPQVLDRIDAVNAAQVQAFAKRYWAAGMRTVIAGDAKLFGEVAKTLAPEVHMVPVTVLDLESPTLKR